MKKLLIVLLCAVTMVGLATSCSNLGSAASAVATSNAAASTLGASTGTALASLYGNYKTTGKLDLTSTTNLSNALILCNAYTQLKANEGNKAYRTAFATGMVTGGNNLITKLNSGNILNALLASSSLAGVNANNISQAVGTASTIIAILNLLKN